MYRLFKLWQVLLRDCKKERRERKIKRDSGKHGWFTEQTRHIELHLWAVRCFSVHIHINVKVADAPTSCVYAPSCMLIWRFVDLNTCFHIITKAQFNLNLWRYFYFILPLFLKIYFRILTRHFCVYCVRRIIKRFLIENVVLILVDTS